MTAGLIYFWSKIFEYKNLSHFVLFITLYLVHYNSLSLDENHLQTVAISNPNSSAIVALIASSSF